MREIKFRAWDNYEKKMWYPRTIGEGFIKMSGLMQFTGMLDKNGVEIYESDIINEGYGSSLVYRVAWAKTYSGYQWAQIDTDGEVNYYYGGIGGYSEDGVNTDVEVIGNIYENPELLGTKSDIAVDIGFKEATNE